MNIVMILIGSIILLCFPFVVLQRSSKVKQENTDEEKKKFNLFLICMMPVPVFAFIFLMLGLKTFM